MLQKNRYLEELGLKTEFYGTNCLGAENNVSQCKLERKNYGFIFLELIDFNQSLLEYIYSRLAMLLEFEFDSHPEGRQSISDFNVYCITFEGREYTILEAINEVKSTIGDYLLLIQENKGEKQLTSIPYGNEMWRTIARVLHLFVEILLYISL